uniref:Taste receptor type 1 member 3 n=1 Tax=Salvator merianae TaxID=96440 RepID=A0A8D0BPX2_SALMN
MALFLLLGVSLDGVLAQDYHCMSSQFKRPGDYILGGLFPFTLRTSGLDRNLPDFYGCDRLYAAGLIWALGMKFAVEEINNSTTLLPGIELGYDIYDTCREPVMALQPSLLFVTKAGTSSIGVTCNYTDYQTRVMAIIGPHNSELSMVTAKLFGFFLIPQVSYGGTIDKLNNEELYPSFLRSVPSDKAQLQAMIALLRAFSWNWIAAVGSDGAYGRDGLSLLSSMVASKNICIAYEGLIPEDVSSAELQEKLEKTIRSINDTQVNVIILFSNDQPVRALFKVSFELGLSKKVWLATEAWLMSDVVTNLKHIQSVGTVIGFIIKGGQVPEFQNYIRNLWERTQQESFCRASQEQAKKMGSDILGPQCPKCNYITLHNVSAMLGHRQTFAVYTAVYSVAYALHNLLRCTEKLCPKAEVKPWQVSEARGFQVGRKRNDPPQKCMGRNPGHITIGSFDTKLHINQSLVQFHTENQKAPLSECLTICQPGQIRRMKGYHFCCYDCIDCERGTFCSSPDNSTCTPCPKEQWSPKRSTRCYDRGEKYLFWSEPPVIVLLALLLFTLTLICLLAVLFLKNLHSPVVQAAGGGLCPLALLSLGLMCTSIFLYIGKPNKTVCRMQQPFYALCLNCCFSTISVKALQIMLVNDFADSRRNVIHTLIQRRPWAIVAACFAVESLLCFNYLHGTRQAFVLKNYVILPTQMLIQCKIPSWINFALIHGHNGLWALVSFLCTFMVQSSPKKYNIARAITFAMLAYFISLVFFIPTYASVHQEHQPTVQIAAMLLCTLGLLASYYLPKCYILCLKPEWNTVDYFQDYTRESRQETDSRG